MQSILVLLLIMYVSASKSAFLANAVQKKSYEMSHRSSRSKLPLFSDGFGPKKSSEPHNSSSRDTTKNSYDTDFSASLFSIQDGPSLTKQSVDDNSSQLSKDSNHISPPSSLYDDSFIHYKFTDEIQSNQSRRSLVPCHSDCNTCSGSTGYENLCTSCTGSRYLVQGFCQQGSCPTGFSTSGNTCSVTTTRVIDLQLNNKILNDIDGFTAGSSSLFYPSYDATDPKAAIERGYWFITHSQLALNSFIFAPEFTATAWVRPISLVGDVFYKLSFASNGIKLSLTTTSVELLYGIVTTSSLNPLTVNSWNHVGVSLTADTDATMIITIQVNGVPDAISTVLSVSYDDPSYQLLLGKTMHAFIYMFQVYTDSNHLSDTFVTVGCNLACSNNSACPPDLKCPSECNINQYPDSGSCSACQPSCGLQGCVRYDYDCVLCSDPPNDSCTSFTINCHSSCSTCSDSTITGCTACASGLSVYDDLCVSGCPTGYPSSSNSCVVDSLNGFVFHLLPHKIEDIVTDSQSSVPVITGLDNDFYPSYDPEDPFAASYGRGYYFRGSSFMQMPPYNAVVSPTITVAPKFTITFWVYNFDTVNDCVLFAKQNGAFSSVIGVGINANTPYMNVELTGSSASHTSTNGLASGEWNFLAFKGFMNGNSQFEIEITVNSLTSSSGDLGEDILSDNSSYSLIGASHVSLSSFDKFYTGFLWEMRIYNYALSDYTSIFQSSGCNNGCSECPVNNSGNCLVACPISSTYTGPPYNMCSSCDGACVSGCKDTTSCNLCDNSLCEDCDDFTGCNSCKTNASNTANCACSSGFSYNAATESCESSFSCSLQFADSMCQCPSNTTQSGAVCECNDGYFRDGNNCNECSSGCKICTGVTSCTECLINFELNSGNCQCPDGYFLFTLNDCESCGTHCKICNGLNACTECLDGYVLENGSCVECQSHQYFSVSGKSCADCEELCLTCTENACLTCVPNAELVNGNCVCNHHVKDSSCVLVMTFDLRVDSDNNLKISFSTSLQSSLTASDFTLTVEDHPDFSHSLELYELDYYVNLEFEKEVKSDSKITVTINDNVLGQNGEILIENTKTEELNYYFPTDEEIESMVGFIAMIAGPLLVVLTITHGNPASLWAVFNTIQFIAYIPLGSYPLRKRLRTFLIAILEINLIPNLFEYFIGNSYERPYEEAYEYGFETHLLLKNSGKEIVTFSFLVLSYACLKILTKIFPNTSFIAKITYEYEYGTFIRWWIELYLEIGIVTIIQLLAYKDIETITEMGSFGFSFLLAIIILITPFFFLRFVMSNKESVQKPEENTEFHRFWGSFFYEFQNAKNIFYFMFFLRRILYMANQVFLVDFPEVQAIVNIFHSLSFVIYIILTRPHKDIVIKVTVIAGEIMIFALFCIISLFSFDLFSTENQETAELWLIYMISIGIGIQISGSIVIFVRSLMKFIRKQKKKNISKISITESTGLSPTEIANKYFLRKANRVFIK